MVDNAVPARRYAADSGVNTGKSKFIQPVETKRNKAGAVETTRSLVEVIKTTTMLRRRPFEENDKLSTSA